MQLLEEYCEFKGRVIRNRFLSLATGYWLRTNDFG